MSYSKQEWVNNISVANQERMNHIENGIYQNSLDIETAQDDIETAQTDIETAQTDIQDLQNQLNDKNIITVGFSSDFTISTAGNNDIALNKIITQVGNKMTLSNGKIVIGNGVSHILVSGNAFMVIKTNGAKNFLIKQNNQEVIVSMNSFSGVSANMNVSRGLGSKLISVAEGDTIGFSIYGASTEVVSSNTSRTYLTVEVID